MSGGEGENRKEREGEVIFKRMEWMDSEKNREGFGGDLREQDLVGKIGNEEEGEMGGDREWRRWGKLGGSRGDGERREGDTVMAALSSVDSGARAAVAAQWRRWRR